ncbi:MAG: hypothetical protein ACYC8V_09045 [Caulobacteraceae bacterium]
MLISPAGVLKAAFVSLVIALSAYGVAKLNLFGLESASDRVADAVYQRITAADYGADRRGQRAISVVFLDDTSLQTMRGFGWTRFPPTYDQQWTMLDDLMNVGGAPPTAMYVDFVYLGEGAPGEGFDTFLAGVAAATKAQAWSGTAGCLADPLVKIACIKRAGGTPIIFAKPSPADLAFFPDAERALDGVTVLSPALVGQTAYPMISRYPFDARAAARLGVHGFDVSPAMALYAARCLSRSDDCGVAAFARLKTRAARALAGRPSPGEDYAAVFDAPMDVVWGSRPDPRYLAITRQVSGRPAPCRGQGGGWRARLVEQLAELRGPGAGARQECPYALSLGYDRIVAGAGLTQGDLASVLAGRLVLVGGEFHASNDWVESPVHGQSPGIQYHAMALDNLIEDGPEYRRNAGAMLDSDLLKCLLLGALTFCGVLGVMARNSLIDHAVAAGREAKLHPKVYAPLYLGIFGISGALVLGATWLGVAVAHRSPINWIGISACALGFLFYATRQTLPADICGSLEHIAAVRRALAAARLLRRAMKFEEDRLLRRPQPPPAPPPQPAPPTLATRKKKVPVHAQT